MTDLNIEPPPRSVPAMITAYAAKVNGSDLLVDAGLEEPAQERKRPALGIQQG
jgi:hypothetical protein